MDINKIKKIVLSGLLFGLFLGGCGSQDTNNATVTKEGLLRTKIGDEYLLDNNGDMTNLNSNKVNLDDYLKKNIKVTGQFSGSTLYVDKLEEK
jgi:hypothetical protein